MGAIKGLEVLNQSCRVTLHSDSQYVVEGIEKGWAKRWRGNGWMRNKREQALNQILGGGSLTYVTNTRWSFGGCAGTLATRKTSDAINSRFKLPTGRIFRWITVLKLRLLCTGGFSSK